MQLTVVFNGRSNPYHNQINARALIGQSFMVYWAGKPTPKFFECSSNIPSGLKNSGLLLLYNISEDTRNFHGFTGTINHI